MDGYRAYRIAPFDDASPARPSAALLLLLGLKRGFRDWSMGYAPWHRELVGPEPDQMDTGLPLLGRTALYLRLGLRNL